jgi:hypothetical protein
VNLQESVEGPDPLTLVGLRVHAVLLVAKLTKPLKPCRGVTVIVEVPALPALTTTDVGLAVKVKSCTVIVIVVE